MVSQETVAKPWLLSLMLWVKEQWLVLLQYLGGLDRDLFKATCLRLSTRCSSYVRAMTCLQNRDALSTSAFRLEKAGHSKDRCVG